MKNYKYILVFIFIVFSVNKAISASLTIKDVEFDSCENIVFEDRMLNLIDLVHIGVCNNPSLKSEYMSVEISKENLDAGKSLYLPTLNASVGANKTWKKEQGDRKNSNNPYSGSLNLSWLIYDFGGRKATVGKLEENFEKSKYSYNVKLHDTILSISKAYFNLLGARELLKSQLANEEMYAKSYEESKRKYELGMISLSDELQAKTSYENSNLAVIKAKNSVERCRGDLAVLLNLSPDTQFNLEDTSMDNDMIFLQSDNIEFLMELAVKNRAELKEKESEIAISEYNIKLAENEFLPSLTATASTSYSDNWKKSYPYEKGSSIGLSLSIPLFDGFFSMNNIAKAKKVKQQAMYSHEDKKNEIENEVWTAFQDYKTSLDTYDKSEQILASAEENYKVAFRSYEIGKIDIVSLLTASSQLAQSRQERINAFYSVLINKVNLYRTIGEF